MVAFAKREERRSCQVLTLFLGGELKQVKPRRMGGRIRQAKKITHIFGLVDGSCCDSNLVNTILWAV